MPGLDQIFYLFETPGVGNIWFFISTNKLKYEFAIYATLQSSYSTLQFLIQSTGFVD